MNGANHVPSGSLGDAPSDSIWVHDLRATPAVDSRDHTVVQRSRVREVADESECARL